jgi:NAD-dependent DNA ligase
VEHLREFFTKRGVTIGATGLATLISANAIQSAPIGLAVTISTAAMLTGTAISTSTAITTAKVIAMTTLQKTAIITVIAAAIGTGFIGAHKVSRLRKQNQSLQQQQAALTQTIQQLQRERDVAANQLASIEQNKRNNEELLRLRSQAVLLRNEKLNTTESEAKSWTDRVNSLKILLEQTPAAQIPELCFLTEQDWLDVCKDLDLKNEKAICQAFSTLRYRAEHYVAQKLKDAMNEYANMHQNNYSADLSVLKPYLDPLLDDSILQRYTVHPTSLYLDSCKPSSLSMKKSSSR